jgi:murein DD-endopeptidase MepM/ murein hydrolase activator NlpD
MASASAPVALGLGGIAAVFLISGIQGKSVGSILQGDFGNPHDPAFAGGEGLPEQGGKGSGSGSAVAGSPSGLISPLPKKAQVTWGRSDQGVDGVTNPGTPLVAMGDGEVTISHDPTGFGGDYPVLHIDGDGSYYYGHCRPAVSSGTKVKKGQVIAYANTNGQGNATTPGAFEFGKWPPGNFQTAGAAIREWFIHLPRI